MIKKKYSQNDIFILMNSKIGKEDKKYTSLNTIKQFELDLFASIADGNIFGIKNYCRLILVLN